MKRMKLVGSLTLIFAKVWAETELKSISLGEHKQSEPHYLRWLFRQEWKANLTFVEENLGLESEL